MGSESTRIGESADGGCAAPCFMPEVSLQASRLRAMPDWAAATRRGSNRLEAGGEIWAGSRWSMNQLRHAGSVAAAPISGRSCMAC